MWRRLPVLCLLWLMLAGQVWAQKPPEEPRLSAEDAAELKAAQKKVHDSFTLGVETGRKAAGAKDGTGKPELDPRHVEAGPFGDRVDLSAGWLFHSGGGSELGGAGVDDGSWTVLDTRRPMFMNGLFAQNEVWYRLHVHLPAKVRGLAVTVADFGGSYRIFANGVELGGHGKMSGGGDFLLSRSATYPVPESALGGVGAGDAAGGQDVVLAIHAFLGQVDKATLMMEDGISSHTRVYLGPANVLYRDQAAYYEEAYSESVATRTLWAVLLALTIGLSILIPRVKVYPVLSVFAGGHLLGLLLKDWAAFHFYAATDWFALLAKLVLLLSDLALMEFFRVLAGVRRSKLLVGFAVVYALAVTSLMPAALGLVSFALWSAATKTVNVMLLIGCAVLLLIGVKRRHQDAVVMASVGGLYLFYLVVFWLLGRVVFFWEPFNQLAHAVTANLRPSQAGSLAVVVAFMAVVLVRTLRIVRERAAIATEIEAARTMQQLLLGQANQVTPGFAVESVYLPAGEVGGDFFLVSPCVEEGQESSLTVVVGDVSGKGMRAAMRVSMILGVLRREPSREPSAVLHGLNQALAAEVGGSGDGGFTTACCVRVSPDGRFTVANAGHIAPYIAGSELATAPALPLGLMKMGADEGYELLSGRLLPGQKIVMMSDGVAEARGHKGELFGFERLGPLTLRPAGEIARTAQQFGQDDDITVVTIACLPRSTNAAPPPMVVGKSSGVVPPPLAVAG